MPSLAVGFDFDHTLGFDNKLEVVSFMRLLDLVAQHGGARPAGDEKAAIAALLAHQRSGACTIDEAVFDFVGPLFDGDDVAARPWVERYKEIALGLCGEYVKAAPGARQVLQKFATDGIKVAILSNGWSPLQQRKAQIVGFSGPVLVSDQIGKQKPDPVAFAHLIETLGGDPANILYVGDNPAVDVSGALAAGLRAIWVDEGLAPYPAGIAPPTHTIRSLGELVGVLGALA